MKPLTNSRCPLFQPLAIKGPSKFMGIPSEIRTGVIAALFEGVTINISVPPTTEQRPSIPGPVPPQERRLSRLTLAQVNEELNEEVYAYVFRRKNVKVTCNDFQTVYCSYNWSSTTLKMFKEVKDITVNYESLWIFSPRSGKTFGARVFPSLESLAFETSIVNRSELDLLRVEGDEEWFVGFSLLNFNYLVGQKIKEFFEKGHTAGPETVFYIYISTSDRTDFSATIREGKLVVHEVGFGGKKLWSEAVSSTLGLTDWSFEPRN